MHNDVYGSEEEWLAYKLNAERVLRDARRGIDTLQAKRELWLSRLAADELDPNSPFIREARPIPLSGRQKLARLTERTHGRGR